jgi:hypothetical protein
MEKEIQYLLGKVREITTNPSHDIWYLWGDFQELRDEIDITCRSSRRARDE